MPVLARQTSLRGHTYADRQRRSRTQARVDLDTPYRPYLTLPTGHTTRNSCLKREAVWSSDTTARRHFTGNWLSTLHKQKRQCVAVPHGRLGVENRELLTGDCLVLVAFCIYKQITAIILHPDFPGWLAPLRFNPSRFEELASFTTTLVASWVIASLLVGNYESSATADLPTALARLSRAWLVSMPVAACQLVILTAAEDKTLVGGDLFASALPLAASGPGEPLATAAGVLGLMAIWRCFYTVFLDFFNARQWHGVGGSVDRYKDMQLFADALRTVFVMCIAFIILIQFLGRYVGEEGIEEYAAMASSLLSQHANLLSK